jgi:hypothetical protein
MGGLYVTEDGRLVYQQLQETPEGGGVGKRRSSEGRRIGRCGGREENGQQDDGEEEK